MTLAKNKFVCVHGHFYQPPRENPWTGEVEPEESAYPYRDWNSLIASQCYGPNAAAPVPDASGRILSMADNYASMSFNFGPSLLRWLQEERPRVYRAVLDADAKSVRRLGRGNAFGQPYVHAILPLASDRDKRTIIRWGIADFRLRFGREPEALWLPETAVDEATLEALAEAGMRFAVLSPHQCARVKTLGSEDWKDVTEDSLNPTRPYRWRSKTSGRELALFFYHGLLSKGIETGEALRDGETLLRKVLARFLPNDSTQLVTAASDGEFFGHHHRFGHLALAHGLERLAAEGVEPVNFSSFLDRFPPPQEAEIREGTSWSCPHGLGRWKEDCGCRITKKEGSHQRWRAPMREALDWLAGELDALYEEKTKDLLTDPWEARDGYIDIILDGSTRNIDNYIETHAKRRLKPAEVRHVLAHLEMQMHRLEMFTSCGWFFDDISGLESVLVLKQACRALELAKELGADLSERFQLKLSACPSNEKRFQDGAKVYARLVAPSAVDSRRLAAHSAILAHLGLGWTQERLGRFTLKTGDSLRKDEPGPAGRDRSASWTRVTVSEQTKATTFECVVLQKDRLDINCWVTETPIGREDAGRVLSALNDEVSALLSERFGQATYSLDALLPAQRREAMRLLMPDPAGGGERTRFLNLWCEALSALRQGGTDEPLLELLSQAKSKRLLPQDLPFLDEVRGHALGLLESLLTRASPHDVSRAMRWVTAFEETGVAIDVWDLQEFHWRWLARLAAAPAEPAAHDAARALGEKLGFSAAAQDKEPAKTW